MKKTSLFLAVILFVIFVGSTAALAMPGGMPAAHNLSGEDFGAAVSQLAQSEPGAVAAHIAAMIAQMEPVGENEKPPHGKPARHGMTGREFGQAVSALARSYPGAVADHIAAMHMPE